MTRRIVQHKAKKAKIIKVKKARQLGKTIEGSRESARAQQKDFKGQAGWVS